MTFKQAVKAGFAGYFDFFGRTSRPGFWYWQAFVFLLSIVVTIAALGLDESGQSAVTTAFQLVFIIPWITIGVRRLHDVSKSGFWMFLTLTIIGLLPLIYWWCQPSRLAAQRFVINPPAEPSPEPFAEPIQMAGRSPGEPVHEADPSLLTKLEQLGRLRDSGVLTSDEFETEKKRLLRT